MCGPLGSGLGVLALVGCLQLTAPRADAQGNKPPPQALVWLGAILWALCEDAPGAPGSDAAFGGTGRSLYGYFG